MTRTVRPYDPATDREALWRLKRAFETGIGADTGGESKGAVYEAKLTDDYRTRYLEWVDRCVADGDCVFVAANGGEATEEGGADAAAGDGSRAAADAEPELAGYAFLLPERLAFVWDAAVLNELYVRPAARGTGLADRLMDAVLEAARAQDLPLDRIVLDVDRENDRARAFYERYGFETWGEMVAREL
jgi:ribosomal protein S18 acetylase RimI-like enzyme